MGILYIKGAEGFEPIPALMGPTGPEGSIGPTGPAGQSVSIVPITAELTVVGWSSSAQTVTVSGVTASNTIIVTPDPTDFDAYVAAKIKVTAQGTNSVSFSCGTVPSVAITVNVLIVG